MYGVKKLIIINADCMVPNKKKDWSLEGFSFFFINRIKEKVLIKKKRIKEKDFF